MTGVRFPAGELFLLLINHHHAIDFFKIRSASTLVQGFGQVIYYFFKWLRKTKIFGSFNDFQRMLKTLGD
jgi:hypothetical protein